MNTLEMTVSGRPQAALLTILGASAVIVYGTYGDPQPKAQQAAVSFLLLAAMLAAAVRTQNRTRRAILLSTGLLASAAIASPASWTAPAQALLTAGPDIIAAPASVLNSDTVDVPPGATNTHQQAFDEQQGVLLTAPLPVDGGAIPAGTVVDSHMIFLNITDGTQRSVTNFNQTWTFDGPILGVMSDADGTLEVASSPMLGAGATAYPKAPFPGRGMDRPSGSPDRGSGGVTVEGYTISGNSITIGMSVMQPGDWIRVITAGNSPPDCSGVTASADALWPPNHKLQTVTLSGLTDPDGDATTITIAGVTQDEPVTGTGDGNTSPDAASGTAPNEVQVRAERNGGGDGRVYRIAFTGTDTSGATCTGTVTVSVPHDGGGPAVDSGGSYNSFAS